MLNKVFKCVIVLAQFTPKICLTQYLFCYKKSGRKNLQKTVIVIATFQEKLMKTCVCINKASGRLWVVKKVGEKNNLHSLFTHWFLFATRTSLTLRILYQCWMNQCLVFCTLYHNRSSPCIGYFGGNLQWCRETAGDM